MSRYFGSADVDAPWVERGAMGCGRRVWWGRLQHRSPLADIWWAGRVWNLCQEPNAVIMVADGHRAQAVLDQQQLACPACGGRLRKHGFSRPRCVRARGGGRRQLRPARVRCTDSGCGRTHVLLPAWCVPGRADDAETIGAALLASAAGQGYRPIAERLGVPADTVRGWLRAARAGSQWLCQRAAVVQNRFNLGCVDPALPAANRTPLGYAVDELGAAAAAVKRFFGAALSLSAWPVILLITGGRLLRPAPVRSG